MRKSKACKYWRPFRTMVFTWKTLTGALERVARTVPSPGVFMLDDSKLPHHTLQGRNKWKRLRYEFKRSRRNPARRLRAEDAVREAM